MSFAGAQSERRIANVIRLGRVVSVDAGAAAAIVDLGGFTSPPLPVGQLGAGAIQFWWMPSAGEQVLIACENGDIAAGIIVCSIYAGNAPSADAAVPQIALGGGTLMVDGTLEVTGDVIAQGVSLLTHIHSGVDSGVQTSGEPVS